MGEMKFRVEGSRVKKAGEESSSDRRELRQREKKGVEGMEGKKESG